MKKTLLTLALALTGFAANSQVVFSVQAPASIAGQMPMSYAAATGASWTVPDLTLPANLVIDTLKLAVDSSPTQDSLYCLAGAAGSLSGKIAVLYRGECGFGVKALNAQNAGAVAVVIINNQDDIAINMQGGTEGMSVTIPVVIISKSNGAIIRAKMDNGETVVVLIGNKTGHFANDLGSDSKHIMNTLYQAIPLEVAQSAADFPLQLGAYAMNYGSALPTGVTMKVEVKKGATSLHTATSAPFDFTAGANEDSVWVDFPAYALTSFTLGEYSITYTVIHPSEQYAGDNAVTTKFNFTNDLISMARLAPNGLPQRDQGSRLATPTASLTSCIVFRSPSGSKIGAKGVYFGITKNAADGVITGEEILVQGYKWGDQFDDIDDPNYGFDALEELGAGTYTYTGNYLDSIVYQPFDTPFMMEDDQRYMFCMKTNTAAVFFSYDTETGYDQQERINRQPLTPLNNATSWSPGFVGRPIPSIGVKTFKAAEAGILETNLVEAKVFPNPAKNNVSVVVSGFTGDAKVTATDLAGKAVMNLTVTTDANGKAELNTSELNNGMYIFSMEMSNGTVSKFNVVINK